MILALLILVLLIWACYELILKFRQLIIEIKKDYKELKKMEKELKEIIEGGKNERVFSEFVSAYKFNRNGMYSSYSWI